MNYHSKIDHTMFKLVSKKVAVRLFTVLSMLFIIQTSAWGQINVKIGGTDYQTGNSIPHSICFSGNNRMSVVFTKATNAKNQKITIAGTNIYMYSASSGGSHKTEITDANAVYVRSSVAGSGTITYSYTLNDVEYSYAVSIGNVRPSLTLIAPQGETNCNGGSIQLDANVSGAGISSGKTYYIDWGDGAKAINNASEDQVVDRRIYTSSQTVTVKVYPDGNTNCSVTKSIAISNYNPSDYVGQNMTLTVCDSKNIQIARPELPDGFTGKWTADNSGAVATPNANVTTITNLKSGTTTFTWKVTDPSGKCSATSTYKVTNNSPVDAALIDDIYLCKDTRTSITVNATGGATFSGTGIDNSGNITVSSLSEGANSFTATYAGSNNCPAVVRNFTVYKFTNPTLVSPTANMTVCGETVPLEASQNPAVYPNVESAQWTGSYINDPTNYKTSALVPAGASTDVKWSVKIKKPDGGTCDLATESRTITNQSRSVKINASSTALCDANDKITLTAVTEPSTASVTWSGAGLSGSDKTVTFSSTTNLTSGSYVVTATIAGSDNNCPAVSDEVTISNNLVKLPDTWTGKTETQNCNGSLQLTGVTPPTGAVGTWIVSGPGAGEPDDFHKPTTTFRNQKSGKATYVWSIKREGCPNDVTQTFLFNNAIPSITLGDDVITCNEKYTLTPTVTSVATGTIQWTRNGNTYGTGTRVGESVSLELTEGANTFTATYSVSGGCTATGTINIHRLTSGSANANREFVCGSETSSENKILLSVSGMTNNPAGTEGTWKSEPAATIGDVHDPNTYAYLTGGGQNTVFTWSISHPETGECTNQKTSVTVSKLELNPTTKEVCSTDGTATLTANGGSTLPNSFKGEWFVTGNGTATLTSVNNLTATVTDLEEGVNHFRYDIVPLDAEGNELSQCLRSVETQVVYLKARATASTSVVCGDDELDPVILTGNDPAPGTGKWEVIEGDGSILNATSAVTEISHLGHSSTGKNTITWTVSYTTQDGKSSTTCTAPPAKVYIENDSVYAGAGADAEFCIADEARLNAANLPTTEPPTIGYWTCEGSAAAVSVSSATSKISNIQEGKNVFKWHVYRESSDGTKVCKDEDEVIIYYSYIPDPDAGEDQYVCENDKDGTCLNATANASGTNNETHYWMVDAGNGTFVSAQNSKMNVVTSTIGVEYNGDQYRIERREETRGTEVTTSYKYYILGYREEVVDKTEELTDADAALKQALDYEMKNDPNNTTGNGELKSTRSTGPTSSVSEYLWQTWYGATEPKTKYTIKSTIHRYYDQTTGATIDYLTQETRVYTKYGSAVERTETQTPVIDHTLSTVLDGLAENGTWVKTKEEMGVVDKASDPQTCVENLNRGLNTFRWRVAKGALKDEACYKDATVNIYYLPIDVEAGDPQYLCVNYGNLQGYTNKDFYANVPGLTWKNKWTNGKTNDEGVALENGSTTSVIENPDNLETYVKGLTPGKNIFTLVTTVTATYKDRNGEDKTLTCRNKDEAIIWDDEVPTVEAGEDVITCGMPDINRNPADKSSFWYVGDYQNLTGTALNPNDPLYNQSGEWKCIDGSGTLSNPNGNVTSIGRRTLLLIIGIPKVRPTNSHGLSLMKTRRPEINAVTMIRWKFSGLHLWMQMPVKIRLPAVLKLT